MISFAQVIILKNGDHVNVAVAHERVQLFDEIFEVWVLTSKLLSAQVMHPIPAEEEALVLYKCDSINWMPWTPGLQIRESEGVELRGQKSRCSAFQQEACTLDTIVNAISICLKDGTFFFRHELKALLCETSEAKLSHKLVEFESIFAK